MSHSLDKTPCSFSVPGVIDYIQTGSTSGLNDIPPTERENLDWEVAILTTHTTQVQG